MNREILIKRVQSISNDIRTLSKVVKNMDVTNIPLILENYEDISVEVAGGRSGLPSVCGIWSMCARLYRNRTICPRPLTPWESK